jgi:predicted short-subunit dehydrogenase-like oxidoreductase (DUF2520 family)
MLPGMAGNLRVAIVGAGKLGTVLAISLRRAGFPIDAVIARARGESLKKAKKLAMQVGGRALVSAENLRADLVWFCVPDSEIAAAAHDFAPQGSWKDRIVFHSSGALSSDELDSLRAAGASVASVHPLMTFVRNSRPSFAGVPFAIEGDSRAVRVARRVVRTLRAESFAIRKQDKAAYHAWGTFASPLLTALLATSERVAGLAGVNRASARRRMTPILIQTVANYAAFGGADAFSGPLIRGDVDTIRRHLQVLRKLPAARDVYMALARAALDSLPVKNRAALKRMLSPSKD